MGFCYMFFYVIVGLSPKRQQEEVIGKETFTDFSAPNCEQFGIQKEMVSSFV